VDKLPESVVEKCQKLNRKMYLPIDELTIGDDKLAVFVTCFRHITFVSIFVLHLEDIILFQSTLDLRMFYLQYCCNRKLYK